MPRKEHLENVKGIFSYLKNFKDASIMFNTEKFDHSQYPVVDHEWKYIYGEVKEDLPKNPPRRPQDAVKTPSRRPKTPQDAARSPQDTPRPLQATPQPPKTTPRQ